MVIDEMGRQMYGLGKLVKKATRAVKKIAKSPIGKAAIVKFCRYLVRSFGVHWKGFAMFNGIFKTGCFKKFRSN